MRNRFSRLIILAAVLALASAAWSVQLAGQPTGFDTITRPVTTAETEVWEIARPDVTKKTRPYTQIQFRSGDWISVEAGGCVQSGGTGRTWHRYVDPSGPNTATLYHGLIGIPRPTIGQYRQSATVQGMVPIAQVIGKRWQIVDSKDEHEGDFGFSHLVLGFEDDQYDDNGYWNHDDGPGDQCRSVGEAWVRVRIEHTGMLRAEPNTNRNGNDLFSQPTIVRSVGECSYQCTLNNACMAMTYVLRAEDNNTRGNCWLKRSPGAPTYAPNMTSAVKRVYP